MVLDTPVGEIHISPINIKIFRDDGNNMIEIHKYGCRVKKRRLAYHDDLDLDDIPWKSVYIDLGNEDRISVDRSNTPWELQVGTKMSRHSRCSHLGAEHLELH